MTNAVWSGVRILLLATVAAPSPAAAQSTRGEAPIFRFETDAFWLNLHHFLHVLGRHESKTADSQREAVVRAPADHERGMARLSDVERALWRDAVRYYAAGPGLKDLVFDSAATEVARALADAGAGPLPAVLDAEHARMLERVAPLYRRIWWPEHRMANLAWRDSATVMVDRHGPAVLKRITAAYGMEWPAAGYAVFLSGYSNWAGAYSSRANLVVVSSLDTASLGSVALESLFHEAMHQWDAAMHALLRTHARAQGKRVPRSLSHALIFYTAGDAVRRVIPGHVPYADARGIYDRGWQALHAAVVEIWQPYLDGRGSRDEALEALVRRVGE